MADNTNLQVAPTFDLTTNQCSLADTSDYASINPSYNMIAGIYLVVAPNGNTIYNNSDYGNPDVTFSSKTKTGILLPRDSNGLVIQGTYKIFFQVLVNGIYYERNFTFNYQYTQVKPSMTISIDGFNSILTSTDNTNYNIYTVTDMNRVHTVTPPTNTFGIAVQSGGSSIISYPPNICSGIWTFNVTNNIVYSINGILVRDRIVYTTSKTVYNILVPAIRILIDTFLQVYKGTTNIKEVHYMSRVLDIINTDFNLFLESLKFNDLLGAYNYLYDIMTLLSPTTTVQLIQPFTDPTPVPPIPQLLPTTQICAVGNTDIIVGKNTSLGVVILYAAQRGTNWQIDMLRIPNDGNTPYVSEMGAMTIQNIPTEVCGITFTSFISGTNLILRVIVDNSLPSSATFKYFPFTM